jgi:signal transduction histidine kinase
VRTPLRYQIVLPLAAVAVASLLAVGVINARLATSQTRSAIAEQLEGVVDVLANSNFPLTDAVLKQMKGLSGAEFVLLNDEAELISASQPELAGDIPTFVGAVSEVHIALGPQILIGNSSYFHSALRLKRPLGGNESGVLHILFPQQRYNQAWRSAFLPPLVVGVITIIAVALVTQWIANRVSRNLATLGAGVQRLAEGDFKPLPIPRQDDELRDLTIAVNQTAARLSEYEQHVRQTEQMRTVAMLGAGLAHEMRNAATGCRLAVDLHAEGCPAAPSDESLAIARSQLQLMENRLQGFLQLGREQPLAEARRLDLAALVGELVPLVLPAARHAGVTIEWQSTHREMLILGHRDAFAMVVLNLLLNAIEAAHKCPPSQGTSQVGIYLSQDAPEYIELEVSDSGAGLRADLADTLFQPFVTTKPEGVGLGLAVAQQVAASHGGEIRWSRDGDRTRFRLRIPAINNAHNGERNGWHA